MALPVTYDVLVIGAGMMGSAAARYASEMKGLRVGIIGPAEPTEGSKYSGTDRDIFAAHYDEARIANSTQLHPIWSRVSARSMEQYRHLEQKSGIRFYYEVGSIMIGTKDGRIVTTAKTGAASSGHQASVLDPADAMALFPFIQVNSGEQAVYQKVAGYVNPRKLIKAELTVARQHGCDVIRDVVSRVVYPETADDTRPLTVHTDLGNTYQCRKVIVATGSFTTLRQLLPRGFTPDIRFVTQSVIYAELSDNDVTAMSTMPSITKHIETDPSEDDDCYILPPVKYPDGKFYIKLGHGHKFDRFLSASEIAPWYRRQVAPEHITSHLTRTLRGIFPGLRPRNITSGTCVTTRTDDKALYIDQLTSRCTVALAGNGHAAKACDYIGKMAADLAMTSSWPADLPRDWFRFQNLSKL